MLSLALVLQSAATGLVLPSAAPAMRAAVAPARTEGVSMVKTVSARAGSNAPCDPRDQPRQLALCGCGASMLAWAHQDVPPSRCVQRPPDKNVWVTFAKGSDIKPGEVVAGFQYGQEIAVACTQNGQLFAVSNKLPPTGQVRLSRAHATAADEHAPTPSDRRHSLVWL